MIWPLSRFRSSLWLPRFVDRSGWNGAPSDQAMLDKAQKHINDLLAQYKKPEDREEKLAAMRKVVNRARRALTT